MNLCWPLNLRIFGRDTEAPAPGPFGDHATLADDLVSYWNLDEQSGVRYDSITASANDLTDNNTVGYVNLGPSGVVASTNNASAESLTSSGTGLKGNQAFTLAGWFKILSTDVNRCIVGRDGVARDYTIIGHDNGSGTATFVAYHLNGAFPNITLGSSTGWNFLVLSVSGTGGTMAFSINSATPTTTTAATLVDVSVDFSIGNNSQSGASTEYASRVGFWAGVLSDAERLSLYNNGVGKSYADLTAAEKVGLVSYWNLDEVSGVRYDSHGSNDLTDNNTVGSTTNSYPANLPGRVASFVATNNEYLSRTDMPASASYTYAAWFKNPGLPSNETLLSHGEGAWNTNSTVEIYSATGDTIQTRAGDGSSGVVTQDASVSTDAWHLVVVTFDDTDKKLRIYVDLDAEYVSSALAGSVVSSTADLLIGDARSTTTNWNGQISCVAIWSRVLTSDERTDLFNSGNGLFYGD